MQTLEALLLLHNQIMYCATFQVSKLAVQLKLSMNANTGSIVTITQPNNATSTVNVRSGNFAVFSETLPRSGNWLVCVNSGRLELSKTEVTSLDIHLSSI